MGRHFKEEMEEKLNLADQMEATLVISWDEVDRLLQKEEYAAAVLVAAVNVEFVLKDHLQQYQSIVPVSNVTTENSMRNQYGNIGRCYLGTCYRVAKHLAANHDFTLQGQWQQQVKAIKDQRDKIAHERGYFARLTELKVRTEDEIRQLIDDAHDFCKANPPNR